MAPFGVKVDFVVSEFLVAKAPALPCLGYG